MLDIAWPELVVIGAVALVAIGPKDLPKVMRMAGQWVGKARRMVQDVQRSFDQLNYETEIAERLQAADRMQREAKAAAEHPVANEPPKPPTSLPPLLPVVEEPADPAAPPVKPSGHDRTDS